MTHAETMLLNVGEMIDLAIGTPEVGVVDFCMLHTVLHCLGQQLGVLGKSVELRGSVAALHGGRERPTTITVTEYAIKADETTPSEDKSTEKGISGAQDASEISNAGVEETASPMKNTESVVPQESSSAQDSILVVEKVKKSEPPTSRGPLPPSSAPDGTHQDTPQARITSTEKLSLVTISKFNVLEDAVKDLKNRVYGSIPKNEDVLEEVRSQTNIKAISDMWTSLNVSSRLEAAEEGIGKLSSLVQDLIADTPGLKETPERRGSKTSPRTSVAESGLKDSRQGSAVTHTGPVLASPLQSTEKIGEKPEEQETEKMSGSPEETRQLSSREGLAAIKTQLERLRGDLENVTNSFYTAVADMQEDFETSPIISHTAPSVSPDALEDSQMKCNYEQCQSEKTRKFSSVTTNLMKRINKLEKRLKEYCNSKGKNDGPLQDQINSLQDQIEYLSRQVADIYEAGCIPNQVSPDLPKDLQGLLTLFQTVQDMQEQLKQVHDTALQLAAEKEDRQMHMDALVEQIELLKTIKLDREDMEEAMAEKVDLRMLARKVSRDQFELACDDLSKGLEHTLGKLDMQEALWQQALDDIQREIEMKLDKMELCPVNDFFNNKLRQLQENLKKIASLRQETEAAGTKRRLLKDVNCISCDKNAVMAMETESSVPVLRPLAPNLSMKPYLSYELDAIRKAQAANIAQRNMHDWEHIEKQKQQKQLGKPRSENDKHLCNRYCGGSHTVTTPSQRVARVGHFVKQWGPDVVPLSTGLAAGDDGRLYKVSTTEGASVGPDVAAETMSTPKRKKIENGKPHKIATSQECRCLDHELEGKRAVGSPDDST